MSESIKVDNYTWVKIEESEQYGIKLIEGWIGRDENFKANFCRREFKKGSGDKNVPMSIKLGADKLDAERVLLAVLQHVTGLSYSVARKDEIPF
jgi:hypothetical protein